MNHHHHVPIPGRVQFPRVEALPFLPDEVKCSVRYPKAFAYRRENLRYLAQVRQHVQQYLNDNISQNYFTGDKNLNLDLSVQEAEVMFGASDAVKQMAQSGQLNDLHNRVQNLQSASENQYEDIRNRLENIIRAVQTKEDEIYAEAENDYEVLKLSRHNASEENFLSIFSDDAFISTSNLRAIDKLKNTQENKAVLRGHHEKLHALLEVQIQALDSLIALQNGWINHVEDDEATQNEVSHFIQKRNSFQKFVHSHHDSADGTILAE